MSVRYTLIVAYPDWEMRHVRFTYFVPCWNLD